MPLDFVDFVNVDYPSTAVAAIAAYAIADAIQTSATAATTRSDSAIASVSSDRCGCIA
jgi:hypothetical protein